MIFLYVILAIIVLFAAFLFMYFRVYVLYRNETFVLYLCLGPIRYKIPTQKRPRFRSLAKQLRKKKLSGPLTETEKSKKKQEKAQDGQSRKQPVQDFLKDLKKALVRMAEKCSKKLHVTIERLYITVGTGDPASTGIFYGITTQSIAYFLEYLGNTVTLAPLQKDAVRINADFTGKWDADIKGTIKIRLIQLLHVLFTAFIMMKTGQEESTQH